MESISKNKGEKTKMIETVETVRERERERANFSKISFINVGKNKLNRYIKRIGYKVKIKVRNLK